MRRPHGARGSAVVEFAVVVPMLMLLVLGVVQVGLALLVRATVTSAAAEGARVAAVSDIGVGVRRTRQVLSASLADGVVDSVAARRTTTGGVATIDLEVRARLPLVGLLGPSTLVVHGHALAED